MLQDCTSSCRGVHQKYSQAVAEVYSRGGVKWQKIVWQGQLICYKIVRAVAETYISNSSVRGVLMICHPWRLAVSYHITYIKICGPLDLNKTIFDSLDL